MSTIKDVAKLTGLSISTISKYLNGGNVLTENRGLIESAIRQLDYRVNQAARSLKTNRTMTVGVLLPALDVPFFSGIISDVETRLLEMGYNTIVCSYNHNAAQELAKLSFMIEKGVDGILLVPEFLNASQILEIRVLRERALPLVMLDRYVEGLACDCVLVDSESACRTAMEQLLSHGHRQVGLISGPLEITTARERLTGYQNALAAYGVPLRDSLIKVGDYSLKDGYRLFNEFMDMPVPPTALLCVNHELTLGAISAARQRGLRIPEDVSFIGYDEVQLSQIVVPPISIVLQPTALMAQRVTDVLLARMHGDYADFPRTLRLQASFLRQQSVCRHMER